MSEIGYGVSSQGSLEDALKAIPSDFDSYVRSGFGQLARLDPTQWEKLFNAVRQAAPYPNEVELGPITSSLNLESDGALPLITAVRLLLGILAFRQDSADEFIAAAIKTNILSDADSDKVRSFISLTRGDRPQLKSGLLSSTLQHSVLPSLTTFEIAIDVRLSFEATNSVALAAPVAVVHIDTDSNEKELWLQMSRVQVEALAFKLAKALDQLRAAEELARKLL